MPPKSRQTRLFFQSSKQSASLAAKKDKLAKIAEITPRLSDSLPQQTKLKSFDNDPRVFELLSKWTDDSPKYHCEDLSPVEMLLLQFDLRYEYGTSVGISQSDRYQRAEKFGLDPPKLLGEILSVKDETGSS